MQKGSMWDGYQNKLPANQRQDLLGQTADNLLILGAGSFGQVIREIAEAMDCFGEIVFLDDDPELGSGPLADYKKLRSKFRYAYAAFVSTKPGAVIKEPVHSGEFVFEAGV